MLPKEPSFCIYNKVDGVEELQENNQDLVRSVTIGDIISDIGSSSDFSFGKKGMGLIEEDDNEEGENGNEKKRVFCDVNELGFEESETVISGFEVDANGVKSGGVEFGGLEFDGNGDVEGYYKRVVKEDPFNPLFLRNYAQLLQGMGLIEEDENEEGERENEKRVVYEVNELGFEESEPVISGFGVDGNGLKSGGVEFEALFFDRNGNVEEYYKRVVKEDPFNPLFLRNCAQLLQDACVYLFNYMIISYIGSSDFSFGKKGMGLIEEDENEEGEKENEKKRFFFEVNELGFEESEPVISGFGVDGNGVKSGGVEVEALDFDGNGDVEEYYKRVLKENPFNPLFLRNYAQLLQSKGDLSGAEHYYFQATLADPKDGDILSQYAKLVWELHQDKDKASDYFERSVHAAPENSHVLAAYASFLWDINDDESEDEMNMQSDKTKIEEAAVSRDLDYEENNTPVSSPLHLAAGLGIGDNLVGGGSPVDYTADVSDMDGNAEENYMRMIKENPHNPVLLRNYARFLSQSKGDLQGAEEYYSRAILADPADRETISHYAILTWQLHRDKYKVSSYFKRAVQASPEDSDVLAAYARFLWQTEEDEHEEEDDETLGDHNGAPLLLGVVAANV